MHYMLRWWETLTRPERIVAMSLATGGVVAITNSTVWAVAVSYMAAQKAKAEIVALQTGAKSRATATARVAPGAGATAPTPAPAERPMPENGLIYSG